MMMKRTKAKESIRIIINKHRIRMKIVMIIVILVKINSMYQLEAKIKTLGNSSFNQETK